MGYQGVEFAWNYGGMSPEELAAFLNDLGLRTCGQHVSLAEIQDPASDPYTYAEVLSCHYLTTSLCNEVEKDWLGTIEQVAKAGQVAREQGMTFTYHNHAQEFELVDSQCALDMLYARTDPQAVQAELDTYWIQKGGQDPVAYIRKYSGRVPQVHLKDMDAADGSFTEVGEGLMDLPAIYDAGADVGAQWMIVEQDTCKRPAIESAEISVRNLQAAGLA
jgi:sugar phosphate isomerase/epimerase